MMCYPEPESRVLLHGIKTLHNIFLVFKPGDLAGAGADPLRIAGLQCVKKLAVSQRKIMKIGDSCLQLLYGKITQQESEPPKLFCRFKRLPGILYYIYSMRVRHKRRQPEISLSFYINHIISSGSKEVPYKKIMRMMSSKIISYQTYIRCNITRRFKHIIINALQYIGLDFIQPVYLPCIIDQPGPERLYTNSIKVKPVFFKYFLKHCFEND